MHLMCQVSKVSTQDIFLNTSEPGQKYECRDEASSGDWDGCMAYSCELQH